MTNTFLGISFIIWSILCLGVAIVYFFVWPKPKAQHTGNARSTWTHLILRWFHSLVWVLLAIACLLWASGRALLANALASLALLLYVVFMATLAADRQSHRPLS